MTLRGAERLRQELKQLKSEARPSVIKAIAEARSHGDLSENAEYHAAREQQSFIEGRINDIENRLSNAEVIDASGREWNLEEIRKSFETAFAPYAKRNASYAIEKTLTDTSELFIATVLWNNALLASEQRSWMHRMTVVLFPEGDEWKILLIQATPVQSL